MKAEQETKEDIQNEEEIYQVDYEPEQEIGQEAKQRDYVDSEESTEPAKDKSLSINIQREDRSIFIYGLAVGLGIGCIATFVIVWISLFFTPKLPNGVTYENLLSIFIYPLVYLLTIGLIALTAGIVKEYYSAKSKF